MEYEVAKVVEQAKEIMDNNDKKFWYMGMDGHKEISQFYEDVTCKVTELLDEKGYGIDVSSQMGIGCVAIFKGEALAWKCELEHETERFMEIASALEGDNWVESVMSAAELLEEMYMTAIDIAND